VSSSSRGAAGKKLSIPRSEYVGDETCARCHQDKIDGYDKTTHHITSQVANKNTIVGTFGPGENTMTTANPNLTFRMDEKGDEFFQTAMWSSAEGSAARTRSERLDLVIGSGSVRMFFFSLPPCEFLPLSQAAPVATLPSALFVERLSLGASWVYSIQ
jgi:hypothetical protein